MAVAADTYFLRTVMHHVGSSVLEIGSRDWQGGAGNMRGVIEASGRRWEGCDLEDGPGVSFTFDVLDPARIDRRWSTVLLFNLLEHVYAPADALRNSLALVEPGGTCVVCGPAIWELHDYPADYWRPMPDFFVEFSRRHGCSIATGSFQWVLNEWAYLPGRPPATRVIPIEELTRDGQKQVPSRLTASKVYGRRRAAVSIALQRSLNLTGRVMQFPTVGLGVVLVKEQGENGREADSRTPTAPGRQPR